MPVGFLSNRHDKPGASGEDACTRDNGSGGPVTGRSGGTTDHAAERGRVAAAVTASLARRVRVGHHRPRRTGDTYREPRQRRA